MKFKFTPRLKVVSAFFMLCLWIPSAFAASNAELESRIAELEKKLEEKPVSVLGGLGDKITLSGAIELDYSYNTDSDVTDNTASSSESDLGIGTIELGLEAALHEYVTANVLLKGEDLDDDDKVFFDEVFFTLAKDGMPVYFVGGKRYQPFGTFESLFINDPITQDLYEINKTGATLGYADEALMGLDVSFTLYKGTSLVEKINDNKDDYGIEYPGTDTSNVSSYIINAGIAPMEGLNIAAFYNSEPGDRDRNTTLGGSIHYEIAGFMADFEYITALERDTV
ncbi:MAG: LbtU family siderophore porin, partial [Desulfobacterales bacterium]|nr:LbtU family siderophore porin [Desulfobacterales bacterium]